MKPVVKWSVRFGLALTTLLLLVPLATLSRVDHTPFRDLPAWQDTAARLQELRTGTNVVVGELRAGFGRARLTPTLGAERDEPDQGRFRAVPLAGYGARQGRPATGVHQELWVKAVAFAVAGQTGVMVSAAALIPLVVREPLFRRQSGHPDIDARLAATPVRVGSANRRRRQQEHVHVVVVLGRSVGAK